MTEQLEAAGMHLLTIRKAPPPGEEDPHSTQDTFLAVYAYLYRVGHYGWKLFTEELGMDGQALVEGQYKGELLSILTEPLLPLTPPPEEMRLLLKEIGVKLDGVLLTTETKAAEWRQKLQEGLPEPAESGLALQMSVDVSQEDSMAYMYDI